MGKIDQKCFMLISVLCCSFLALFGDQGTFKTQSLKKPLNISLKTKQFLQKITVIQRLILADMKKAQEDQAVLNLVQSMVQIHEQIISSGVIISKNIGQVLNLVNFAKKILFDKSVKKPMQSDALWIFLKRSLTKLQAFGFEQDLMFLRTQIEQLNFNQQNLHDAIVHSLGICSNILYRFDGVMLTDYDFFVLANIAVALAVMQN